MESNVVQGYVREDLPPDYVGSHYVATRNRRRIGIVVVRRKDIVQTEAMAYFFGNLVGHGVVEINAAPADGVVVNKGRGENESKFILVVAGIDPGRCALRGTVGSGEKVLLANDHDDRVTSLAVGKQPLVRGMTADG